MNASIPERLEAAMAAKPKMVERRMTTGNIWTMAVMVAGLVGGTGYQHFVPSESAKKATVDSAAAVEKATAAAVQAALTENTVATHTQELSLIAQSVDTLRIDVAVLKSQGDAAKAVADKQSDKLDRILSQINRLQGNSGGPSR
jgi:hypothetical protein